MKAGLREDALYVQTFGGFSLSYKGKVIIDDTLKEAIDAYYEQYGASH